MRGDTARSVFVLRAVCEAVSDWAAGGQEPLGTRRFRLCFSRFMGYLFQVPLNLKYKWH